jgi:hypothetical protein
MTEAWPERSAGLRAVVGRIDGRASHAIAVAVD